MSIILNLVSWILSAFDILLLVRALCSWVPSFRNSMIYRLSYAVTEPILSPVRDLLYRFEWVRRSPIDISFLVVLLLVNGLSNAVAYLSMQVIR